MRFIKNSLNKTPKKKKLPVWAHPYKDLFHNDISIIASRLLKSIGFDLGSNFYKR